MLLKTGGGNKMPYDSEAELFDTALNSSFIKKLNSDQSSCMLFEPKGLFGVPDLLIANPKGKGTINSKMTVISFEMKLRNWKRALSQAFKYRAFSNISYVVIDYDRANPALRNLEIFERSNVGLLSINSEGLIQTHYEPTVDEPYCDDFREKVNSIVLSKTQSNL